MPRQRTLRRISDEDEFETDAFRTTDNADERSNKRRFSDSESNDDEELESGEDEERTKQSCEQLYASSDDDSDAPEDVAFSTSKTSALQEIKRAMSSISSQRSKKKEKRKKLDDKFRDQKKRKLQALADCKLPADILDAVPERPDKTINKGQDRTAAPNESDGGDSDSGMDKCHGENYIPLSADRSSGIHAVPLKNEKLKCITDTVAEFRHRALYNSKIRRESTQSMLSKKVKRRAQMTRQ